MMINSYVYYIYIIYIYIIYIYIYIYIILYIYIYVGVYCLDTFIVSIVDVDREFLWFKTVRWKRASALTMVLTMFNGSMTPTLV